MVDLPRTRPESTHLEHQPLQNRNAFHQIFREELAGLLAQIQQNRARFEHTDGPAIRAVGVDDGGDLVVRTDLQEFGFELLIFGDIDDPDLIGQRHFFKRD